MSITVEGSTALTRKFDSLSTVVQGRSLERALVAGALLIQNEAKRQAPIITGNLRRSIHIGGHNDLNPGGTGILFSSGVGVPEPEIGAVSAAVYVGTDVVYAGFVEFGTSRMAPQPYLRPAFDRQYAAAVREVGATLLELIQKAAA